jgi:chromosomal replication initiator protein
MIAQLVETAARTFEVPRTALLGRSRRRHIVYARQALAWALRHTHPELSLSAIGDLLGGRDHTTIIWAIEAAERRAKADPRYAVRLGALVAEMEERRAWYHLA